MENFQYLESQYWDDYKVYSDKDYYKNNFHPHILEYSDAVVLPFKPLIEGSPNGKGGCLTSESEYINASALEAENLMNGPYEFNIEDLKKSDCQVVWGGYYLDQWGHFLVDVLPRFWFILNKIEYDYIILTASKNKMQLSPNIAELLKAIGIDLNKIKFIKNPTRFKKLYVPELSMKRPHYYSDEFKMFMDHIRATVKRPELSYDKVYLTRTGLKKAKQTEIGEKEIETIFRKNGYHIVKPEKLSFLEQLSIYADCKEIVTTSGTLPHNMIFSPSSTKWTIINRNVRINTIQFPINQLSGCEVIYIDSYIQLFPVSPTSGPYWYYISNSLIAYLRDNGLKYNIGKNGFAKSVKNTINAKKYCLKYLQYKDSSYDIGGEIIASTRPLSENTGRYDIYFNNRVKLDPIYTDFHLHSTIIRIIKTLIKSILGKSSK